MCVSPYLLVTMVRWTLVVVFVTFCVNITLTNGACVPRGVIDLVLMPNSTLSWAVSYQETCEITHFNINIQREGHEDYNLNVTGTGTDVSFLSFCDYWVFTVRAVSQDSLGVGHLLIARTPMPPTANLSLSYLDIADVDGDPRLTWDVADAAYKSCADSFRVTVEDEENGVLKDHYLQDRFMMLDFLSSCVTYEFEVRAINLGQSTEGPLKSIQYEMAPARQNPPKLTSVSVGPTEVNTTWTLDSLSANRCPIRTLYVDGGQYFNISFPITDIPDRETVIVDLRSLKANSMYVLKVSVENSAGVSNPSIVGVQTLDLDPGTI